MATVIWDGPATTFGPKLFRSDDDPDVALVNVVNVVEARTLHLDPLTWPQNFKFHFFDQIGVERPRLGVGSKYDEDDDALKKKNNQFFDEHLFGPWLVMA